MFNPDSSHGHPFSSILIFQDQGVTLIQVWVLDPIDGTKSFITGGELSYVARGEDVCDWLFNHQEMDIHGIEFITGRIYLSLSHLALQRNITILMGKSSN